tara:strand:- start:147 stop:542 length:396 start_codon:yes stop_codon:yes gene_type:complete
MKFEGEPCKRGHTTRYTKRPNVCVECARASRAKYNVSEKGRRVSRSWCLKSKYDLSYEEYLSELPNGCSICSIAFNLEEPKSASGVAVDHCHESGHVRGLLCNSCNVGIGHFYDNPDLLIAAANYLKEKPR